MISFAASGQANINPENKGKLYVLWGWNWGYYSKSDIHFTGTNYDFELKDVKAQDRQTPFSFEDYFGITSITIPQTNFRIGYYINDNLNIAVGVDHMKYFMINDQTVKINGYIDQTGTIYDGVYSNDDILLTTDFLSYEHSDGLNYINAEINYVKDILSWVGNPKEKLQVYVTGGVSAGFLLPKTNSQLMGRERHDDFNVAGYGMALKAGVNITFYKYFFVQSELKGGFINMPNVRTTHDKSDGASQHFFYLMPDILIGVVFKIAHKN
ncbi:MAG: hypothetical protein DRI71_12115 [Bacteroidetes bacterium]|nr:MAG: hypothetical protein DRI71_12115 [Bacteroidota bacterium]